MRIIASRLAAGRSCHALLLILGGYIGAAHAATDLYDWGVCRAEDHVAPIIPATPAGMEGTTVLTADDAQMSAHNIVTMKGGVEATRDGQVLRADTAVYDKDSGVLDADGNVQYLSQGLVVDGDSGKLNLDTETGRLDNAHFRLYERHARGNADTAVFVDKNVMVLKRAMYTTCDTDNEDWLLRSSRVRLDRASGTGTARNVYLSFKGVPFLYTPWLSFPIDDRRKSGFLPPNARDSSRNGIEISAPYYLNLAPRFDATLTPRLLSRRGAMLETEFRYLNPASEGVIDLEYLPDDKLAGEDRSLLRYRHFGRAADGLSTDIDFNRVSDSEYFRDLGDSLSIASVSHLDQHALMSYQADTWMASGRLQSYQTIDKTIPQGSRPYQQLPVLMFRTQRPEYNLRPNYRFVTSYANFQHRERIGGQRTDLQPSLTMPLYALAAYIQPTFTLRHTRYALDDQTLEGATRPERTLPMLTIDAGIFLERDTRWGGLNMLQTLEPRLYYLNVPFRAQSSLPLFDTGRPDFNFSQIFRDNRFNGSDRVGDANQLSVALTTRYLERDTGRQRVQAGIGRIYYFQDREVTLSGLPETAAVSDIVAEASANFTSSISTTLDARQSEATGKIDKAGLLLQYKPAPRSIVNVSYRFRESTLEQTDLALIWPLGARWHLIARHNYSLLDHRDMETLAGFEYQSCCWRLRVVNRRYIDSDLGEYNRSIYVQLDLIGLTSLGDRLENLLDHGILGY